MLATACCQTPCHRTYTVWSSHVLLPWVWVDYGNARVQNVLPSQYSSGNALEAAAPAQHHGLGVLYRIVGSDRRAEWFPFESCVVMYVRLVDGYLCTLLSGIALPWEETRTSSLPCRAPTVKHYCSVIFLIRFTQPLVETGKAD